MEIVLETNNLEKKYKGFKALNGTNIHIEKGSIYGLIGKNGAGKTTLIRVITDLQKPASGSYSIYGVPYNDKSIYEMRKRIGGIVETPSIYNNMTARENIIEQYKIIGMPNFDEVDNLLLLVGLGNTGNKKVKNFSLGMKQRLGIAIALSSNPDFLILDEPINGLDPEGIIEIRELILKLNKKYGITILISSHYLDELSKVATHYGFLDKGRIIKEINAKDLAKQMQKRVELTVDNMKATIEYLENQNINYEVKSDKEVYLYEDIDITKIILDLSNKCKVEKIHETEETLENYYINLLGGENNE